MWINQLEGEGSTGFIMTAGWKRVGVTMPRGHLGLVTSLGTACGSQTGIFLLFRRAGVFASSLHISLHFQDHYQRGCWTAISPAGTERCPQRSGHWWHWGDEVFDNWWIFYERVVPADTGPVLAAQQHSQSVNIPRVFMPSVAFPVGLNLAYLLSLSQKKDAEVTVDAGWLSWKFTVFKFQFHTQISEVGSASKGEGN